MLRSCPTVAQSTPKFFYAQHCYLQLYYANIKTFFENLLINLIFLNIFSQLTNILQMFNNQPSNLIVYSIMHSSITWVHFFPQCPCFPLRTKTKTHTLWMLKPTPWLFTHHVASRLLTNPWVNIHMIVHGISLPKALSWCYNNVDLMFCLNILIWFLFNWSTKEQVLIRNHTHISFNTSNL